MRKTVVFISTFVVLLSACLLPGRRNKERVPIEFTLIKKSPLFTDTYFKLYMDSVDNKIRVFFNAKSGIDKFPFLKSASGQPMNLTVFNFNLLKSNQIIASPVITRFDAHNYSRYNPWASGPLSYLSDTLFLDGNTEIKLEFPLYVFNSLPAGEHEIELEGKQGVFCSPMEKSGFIIDPISKDTNAVFRREIQQKSLVFFRAKFKILVPPVYKTMLYSGDITLRNDSVYSPAGMDRTLWKSSLPDIYWGISYPVTPSGEFYCRSDYQTSTDRYTGRDTFCLYHYSPSDSIGIYVSDYDNLSKDDYISSKNFGLNEFRNNSVSALRFENIQRMELKTVSYGRVNK